MPKMTLEEMETKIGELNTKYEASLKDIETFKAEAEKAKKAAEDKKDDPPKDDDSKEAKMTRRAAFKKHMKAATEEKDEAKKAEHLKEAAKNYKAGDEEDDKEDDKEKDAMKAELTVLRAELSKDRLKYLTASYTGKVKPETLTAYQANWSKMDIPQLDAEIAKISVFVGSVPKSEKNSPTPIGYGTFQAPQALSASTDKDEFTASLEKKSDSELFV